MHHVPDSDLLQAARDGQQEAFADLYRRHVGAARREARRRCRRSSAADDAVASAFASVFRTVMNGGGPLDHFRAYLLTAVRNAVIDQSRRRDVEYAPLPDAELPDESNPVAGESLGASLGAAFLSLPDRQRDALWKTEVEGRTNTEMAELLDLSENAFAALKKRARQNLSSAYERELIGDVDLCVWIADRVEIIVAGQLGHSRRLMIDLHVDSCDACSELLPERTRTTAPLLGLPLLLAAPIIRRGRGPAPTWWSGARGVRLAAAGPQHAAALVGLVAGAAAVVGLLLGGAEPEQTITHDSSTTAGVPVLDSLVSAGSPTAGEERSLDESIEEVTLRRGRSSASGDGDRPTVVTPDREHRSITRASTRPGDGVSDPTGEPAPHHGSDDGADSTGAPSAGATEPATPTTISPQLAGPTTVPPSTVAVATTTTSTTTTTTTTTSTTVPLLIGAIAVTTTTTTTTVPPLIGTIPTTTTVPPLMIGTIATTTTTVPTLIGTVSP